MTAKEFLNSKNIWEDQNDCFDEGTVLREIGLEKILDEYYQHKLKLLGIADVVGQSEQLFCDEHTPKVRYDWQKGNCLTCAKKLEAK